MPVTMSGSPQKGGARSPPVKDPRDHRNAAAFSWDNLKSDDVMDQDLRDNATIAAHRTAARTGTTFNMADLLTNGTATKLPNTYLPSDHPAMKVIGLNEMTMPGDVLGQSPRHPPVADAVEQRMSTIIRERSLDIINLMDDFLKRPAYSRMPTRNRSFLDVPTFRRAMCYAMGDQWTRLAMTSYEFKAICDKYQRLDAAHGSQGTDVQGFGQPEPLILWQPFAYAVQKLADGDKYTIKLRGTMDEETRKLYEQSVKDAQAAEDEYAARSALDIGHTTTSNTAEAMEGLRQRQVEKRRQDEKPIGKRGARHGQVEAAKVLIRDRLLQKYSTVRAALKAVDDDGSGTLTREEVKKMLKEFYLMKYFDFYTGQTRGDLDPKVVDTLLDIVDVNEDGTINYTEFSQVVMAGAN